MWRALGLVLLLATAGCAGPSQDSGSPSCPSADLSSLNNPPKNLAPAFEGTGRFVLAPESPRLVPGETLQLEATYSNPDECTFFYREGVVDCGNTVFRLGAEPFVLYGWDGPLQFDAPVAHSCGAIAGAKWQEVGPGDGYVARTSWNGSFRFWDHASVEAGGNWTERTYWAAPGNWSLEYGFDRFTSHAVAGKTALQVAENDLNRASTVDPNRCSVLRGAVGGFTDVNVTLSQSQATIGTPISVTVRYTLQLPAAGCYIFAGEPQAEWSQGLARRHSLGGRCAGTHSNADPFIVLVRSNTTTIPVTLSYTWDGTGPEPPHCRAAAAPGPSQFAFREPVSISARELAVTSFEWMSP